MTLRILQFFCCIIRLYILGVLNLCPIPIVISTKKMFKSIQLDPRYAFTPVDRGEFFNVQHLLQHRTGDGLALILRTGIPRRFPETMFEQCLKLFYFVRIINDDFLKILSFISKSVSSYQLTPSIPSIVARRLFT